jgi:hypothetical protein
MENIQSTYRMNWPGYNLVSGEQALDGEATAREDQPVPGRTQDPDPGFG